MIFVAVWLVFGFWFRYWNTNNFRKTSSLCLSLGLFFCVFSSGAIKQATPSKSYSLLSSLSLSISSSSFSSYTKRWFYCYKLFMTTFSAVLGFSGYIWPTASAYKTNRLFFNIFGLWSTMSHTHLHAVLRISKKSRFLSLSLFPLIVHWTASFFNKNKKNPSKSTIS